MYSYAIYSVKMILPFYIVAPIPLYFPLKFSFTFLSFSLWESQAYYKNFS